MPNEEITTRFKCDISDLKKGITEANKAIKLANAEFKAASAGMDDWSSTSDGLSAKLKQLNSVLESQKQKLQSYKSQQEALNKSSEENGRRASELKQKLQELASQGVSKTSAEYKKYKSALDECEKEQQQNKTAAENLKVTILNQQAAVSKTEKEISDYKSELDNLESEAKGAEKASEELNDELDNTEKSANNAKGGFTVLKGALANLVADGFRMAIRAVKDFAKSMITSAADAQAMAAQYEQTFGDAMDDADQIISDVAESTEILHTRLTKSATAIYAFAKASGADTPKAMSLMETSLTAAADAAAYYDMSLEDATERLQAFMKGNFANDAALGVSCTEMTRNAKATELFGKKYNDLTEIQKQETLLKMVTDSQKLSGAMGQASRESGSLTNQLGNLSQRWTDFKATIGGAFLEGFVNALETADLALWQFSSSVDWAAFGETVGSAMSSIASSLRELYEKIDWNAFGERINKIGSAIVKAFSWMLDHQGLVVGGFAAISGIVGTIKLINLINDVDKLVKIVKSWELVTKAQTLATKAQTFAAEAQTAAQWLLNAAMNASPITWIIIGITALVAAFVLLWKNCEGFRNFWINLWENIKTACSTAGEWIKNTWNSIGQFFTETIPQVFQSLVEWFISLGQQIKDTFTNMWNSIVNFFTQTIPSFFEQAKQWFSDFVKSVIQWFEELPYKVGYWLGYFAGLVVKWAQQLWNIITVEIPKLISSIVKWFSALPSKVWTWLLNTLNKVKTWATDMVQKGKQAALDFVNKIIEYVKGLPEKVRTWLTNVINAVKTWATEMVQKGKQAALDFINRVIDYVKELPDKVWTWLSDTLNKVKNWGTDLINKGKDAAKQLVDTVVSKVKELPGEMLAIGKNIVDGLWNGIKAAKDWLTNKVGSFVNGIVDGFKNALGINSPSKTMRDEIGKWIPEGIAVGIDKNAKGVLSSIKDLTMGTVNAAKNGLNSASFALSSGSGISGGTVNNFTQIINSPKQLSRLDIYRQSKNLLGFAGGGA